MLGTRRRLVGVPTGVGASPQHPYGALAADRPLRGAESRSSAVVADAPDQQPTRVTRRGRASAVLAVDEYGRLRRLGKANVPAPAKPLGSPEDDLGFRRMRP